MCFIEQRLAKELGRVPPQVFAVMEECQRSKSNRPSNTRGVPDQHRMSDGMEGAPGRERRIPQTADRIRDCSQQQWLIRTAHSHPPFPVSCRFRAPRQVNVCWVPGAVSVSEGICWAWGSVRAHLLVLLLLWWGEPSDFLDLRVTTDLCDVDGGLLFIPAEFSSWSFLRV